MSSLRQKLAQGEFVITVELEPPKGVNMDKLLHSAWQLEQKVDAINITDSPMANMRMSPISVAHILQREVGLDAIFHLTCRDRNLIGLQSELLGAAALGVQNILVLTGDDPKRGDHPTARGIFEVDSVGLVHIANTLNQGFDLSGNPLNQAPDFYIGVAANPCADDLEREAEKVRAKITTGAHFIQTQPVYELESLQRFLEQLAQPHIPVIAGILPLKSYRMACHIAENIPGIHIPPHLLRAMESGGRATGMRVAQQLLADLPACAQGAHIMPVGDAGIVTELLAVAPAPVPIGNRVRSCATTAF